MFPREETLNFEVEVLSVAVDSFGSLLSVKLKKDPPAVVKDVAKQFGLDNFSAGSPVELHMVNLPCAQVASTALLKDSLSLEVSGVVETFLYSRESFYTPKIYFAQDSKIKTSVRCVLSKSRN